MPSSVAASPPIGIATSTGTPNEMLTRAAMKAPKPATTAWNSVIWPANPVMHTIDVNVIASATVICA